MTTIVFVHGINVRHADFKQTFDVVTQRVNEHIPGAKLVPCEWGDDFGASLRCEGRSIPTYDTTKDALSVLPEMETATLWSTLYQDPLFELRLLTGAFAAGGALLPPNALAAADDWLAALDSLPHLAPLAARLARAGLLAYFDDALAVLRTADELAEVMHNFDAASGELPGVAARAITAALMRAAAEAGRPALQGDERDAIVNAIEDGLGGAAKGLMAWIAKPFVGLARSMADRYLRRNRHSLSDLSCPVVGDVIVYQGRGAPIRERISQTLRAAGGPVVVIAHSLGGVAVVDTLLLDPGLRDHVTQLVTVGSQSGFFYEINGLVGMPYALDAALPANFPPWLNFYDKADMLSYLAAPIFGAKAHDVEVASDQPFPQSHSAYWTSTPLWTHIAKAIAR